MISPAPVDQADLIAGYQRAGAIKAVPKEDLNKVYSEYGLKGGEVKGKSDTALQQRAAKAVVDWWKKQQVAAATPAVKPAAAASKPPSPATGTAKPAAAAPTAAPAGNAVRQGIANKINVMETADATRAAAVVSGYVNASPRPGVTTAQATATLKSAGLAGTTPPSYALVSAEALSAWIARVKYNRSLIAKKPSVAMSLAERAPAPAPAPIPRRALPTF